VVKLRQTNFGNFWIPLIGILHQSVILMGMTVVIDGYWNNDWQESAEVFGEILRPVPL
jgi:hypothetical protein